jgi:hypothetical protein
VIVAFAALILPGSPGLAMDLGEGTLAVSEDVEVRYFRADGPLEGFEQEPNLLDYMEQVSRTNLLWIQGPWTIGAQVDQLALFLNRYYLDDELVYEHEPVTAGLRSPFPDAYATLEKVWVGRKTKWGDVQLGDGYVSFGRGLALNLVRNTDIDLDTSLRGLQTKVSQGDWEITAAGGWTNQQQVQQDNPNYLLRPDRQSLVAGLRVDRFALGPTNVGVHSVAYRFARETADIWEAPASIADPLDVVVAGGTLEWMGLAGMDWFVEGDVFHHFNADLHGGEAPELGSAIYASTAAYLGAATVLVEVKRYDGAERLNTFPSLEGYEVVSGPTLEYERVITEDSSASVNSNDIAGGRATLYLDAFEQLAFQATLGVFRDRELGGLHFNRAPETIVHPVVGVEYFGETLQCIANAGIRQDFRYWEGDQAGDPFWYTAHVDGYGVDVLTHLDVAVDFPLGPWHGELIVDAQRFSWGDNVNQQSDFSESSTALGIRPSDAWTLVLYNDYSDNPLIPSEGNLSETQYGALELQAHLAEATTLKAFYGAYKAGIRCAGGQCRNLPGFEGARLSLTTNF